MLLDVVFLYSQFLLSPPKTCLPGFPGIPRLRQWQQQSSNFTRQKLGRYSGLRISPSCRFQSTSMSCWFYPQRLSASFRSCPSPLWPPRNHHPPSSLARTITTILLTKQKFPSLHACCPPIYSIAAANITVLKTKSDQVSFLFRKIPSSFLPRGLYALLFYWNDFYTPHMDHFFSSSRFQTKCHRKGDFTSHPL